jgi:hypothetical protein
VAYESTATQYRDIQLFAKLIFYIFFYFTDICNAGCHAEKSKAKVSGASSAIIRPQLLSDVMANNLDSDSNYLYQMLMNQLENEIIEIDFPIEVFGYQGTLNLCFEDVMELLKNEMLNISIIQFFVHVSFLNLKCIIN